MERAILQRRRVRSMGGRRGRLYGRGTKEKTNGAPGQNCQNPGVGTGLREVRGLDAPSHFPCIRLLPTPCLLCIEFTTPFPHSYFS